MTYVGVNTEWLKEHDAAITAKAVEDVLNEVETEINLCRFNLSWPEISENCAIHLLKKVESLRSNIEAQR